MFIYRIADRAEWGVGLASVFRSDVSFLTRENNDIAETRVLHTSRQQDIVWNKIVVTVLPRVPHMYMGRKLRD